EGMIRGDHPRRRDAGLFLRGKWASSLVARGACQHFSFARGRDEWASSLLSGYYNTPAAIRERMSVKPRTRRHVLSLWPSGIKIATLLAHCGREGTTVRMYRVRSSCFF